MHYWHKIKVWMTLQLFEDCFSLTNLFELQNNTAAKKVYNLKFFLVLDITLGHP